MCIIWIHCLDVDAANIYGQTVSLQNMYCAVWSCRCIGGTWKLLGTWIQLFFQVTFDTENLLGITKLDYESPCWQKIAQEDEHRWNVGNGPGQTGNSSVLDQVTWQYVALRGPVPHTGDTVSAQYCKVLQAQQYHQDRNDTIFTSLQAGWWRTQQSKVYLKYLFSFTSIFISKTQVLISQRYAILIGVTHSRHLLRLWLPEGCCSIVCLGLLWKYITSTVKVNLNTVFSKYIPLVLVIYSVICFSLRALLFLLFSLLCTMPLLYRT